MSNIKKIQAQRTKLFTDVYNNVIPERVPVNLSIPFEPIAQYGNLDLTEIQWRPEKLQSAAEKFCEDFYSDICPISAPLRFPSFYTQLQSQSFVMGSNGFIQHPEVTGMLPEEYDYLIEKPLDCLYEKILPRQYKGLNLDDPVNSLLNFTKAMNYFYQDMSNVRQIMANISEKYGYYYGNPDESGFTEAPADFLADQLRGFIGFIKDTRKLKDKVINASEALYPIVMKKGMPKKITDMGSVFFPLHMPTFMRAVDFEKYWWPSFLKLINEYASLGIHTTLFCEDNWTRYADYLYELPVNTRLIFEYGDPQILKDKLGKKHILSGLYPIILLKTGTKERCIDKAKELLDIMAPGGKYLFSLDKSLLQIEDVQMENFIAVAEYVRDHGNYHNAGQKSGLDFRREDYSASPSRELDSKYYKTREQIILANPEEPETAIERMQQMEDMTFHFAMHLLV